MKAPSIKMNSWAVMCLCGASIRLKNAMGTLWLDGALGKDPMDGLNTETHSTMGLN